MSSGTANILRLPQLSLIAAVVLAVFLAVGAPAAHATDPPTMRLDPAQVIYSGQPGFKVDVLIEDVTNFGGFGFTIFFDDAHVNAVEIRAGPFLGSLGADVDCSIFDSVTKPELQGSATIACNVLGKDDAASGSGVIASIDFTVKEPPTAGTKIVLSLQQCEAFDAQGDPLAINGCKDGSFVGGIAELPDGDAASLATGATGGGMGNAAIGAIAAGAAGAVALGGVAWRARRRRA